MNVVKYLLLFVFIVLLQACTDPTVASKTPKMEYYKRASLSQVNLEEVPENDLFTKVQKTPNLNFGFDHWFRVEIPSPTPEQSPPLYLQIDFPNIDSAMVYVQYADSVIRAGQIGDDVKHTSWPISTRLPTIPISDGERIANAVYLNLSATGQPAVLPLSVIDLRQYIEKQQIDYLWYGLFFGAAFSLILYNLFLYLKTGLQNHLAYVVYLSVFTFLQASITGIGQQYLWPQASSFTTLFALVLIGATNSAMAVFVSIFLDLKNRRPIQHLTLTVIAVVSMLILVGLFFTEYIYIQNVQHVFSLLSMLIIMAFSISEYRRGSRPAIYLLISYTMLFSGIIMALLHFNGLVKSSFLTGHLMEIAIVFEALVLSLGLADRINELKAKTTKLEKKSLENQERFTRRLVSIHESEKQNFGAILHDDIGHQVLNLKYGIDSLKRENTSLDQEAKSSLNEFTESTSAILDELRHLAMSSHPQLLSELGLELALDALLKRALPPRDILYSCSAQVSQCSVFTEQQLFRIVQELVSNTLKHANASEVLLNITQKDESIELLYKDDGVGSQTQRIENNGGFGLVSIRERCKLISGELTIDLDQPTGMVCFIRGINANG